MTFDDFYVNKKVIHTLRKEWGVGNVQHVYSDRSILVHFPNKEPTHPDNINLFRYYEKGLQEFIEA